MLITKVGNDRNWRLDALFFYRHIICRHIISLGVLSVLATSMLGCMPVSETNFQAAQRAIEQNDIQKLKQVLGSVDIDEQVSVSEYNYSVEAGYTLLHFAVEQNRLEMVNYLLESGANPNLYGDFQQRTPIMNAILMCPSNENTLQIINALVKHGADVNASGIGGIRPLHMCSSEFMPSNFEVRYCELLLQNNADINAKDETGWTPLHFAASQKDENMVETLLRYGADVSLTTDDGKTALDYATESGNAALMKLFSEAPK